MRRMLHILSRARRRPHRFRPGRLVALLFCLGLGLGAAACQRHPIDAATPARKIRLKLDALDAEGLTGPPGGLRAVRYEFCIPDRHDCRAEVYRLDPSVEFMPGSRGRAGCGPGELLCVGNTHQPDWRQVLNNLAQLGYVARIVEWTGE
jgi:hypothetical protein